MKVAVTGSSGMIGSALVSFLSKQGHEPLLMVRSRAAIGPGRVFWNPESGEVDLNGLAGTAVVVNLAGDNIAAGRWTPERKRRIRDSRVTSTHVLEDALVRMPQPPQLLVSVSAIGYYGDTGDRLVDESSAPGHDFLAQVCQEWEEALLPLHSHGIRTAVLRLGVVISSQGGVLSRLLPLFRWGLGGSLGAGTQWMSWVDIDDVLRGVDHVMTHRDLEGAFNLCAPQPVTNCEFTVTLARLCHRPAWLSVPRWVLRARFGEMADAFLLASCRVVPQRLLDSGFTFLFPTLEASLKTRVATYTL